MRLFLLTLIISVNVLAGFPPTTSKLNGESAASTTFNYEFPHFTGTRTGITTSLGTLGIAGGGTGVSSFATNRALVFYDNTGAGSLLTHSELRLETDLYGEMRLYTPAVTAAGQKVIISNEPFAIGVGNDFRYTATINSGSPVVESDFWMNNFSANLFADDDIGIQSLTQSGIVASGSFLIPQVASTKTVSKISAHQGLVAPTGAGSNGTITEVSMYNSMGLIDLLGGEAGVTNLYGFKHSNYGNAYTYLTQANHWGLYIEDAPQNYLSSALAIGTTSKKVANSSVGLEIGGTTKAMRLPVLTTAQKNALTPLAGMEVYDSDLGKISVYNGSIWQENTFGIVPLADGGTNKNMTASAGSVTYSDADSLELSTVGTAGQALISGGAGAPTWYAPTAGSILFAGTGGILEQDNTNLNWDNTAKRLGVGDNSTTHTVHGVSRGSTLTVSEGSTGNAYEVAFHRHSNSLNPVLSMIRSRGDEATPVSVNNGDILSEINFLGFDGTDYEFGSQISSVVDGTPGSNDMPASLNFYTVPDGSFTPALALKLGQDKVAAFAANVVIGGTTPTASTILDLQSTTGALKLPSMTTTQRNALTASDGMMIYNSTMGVTQCYFSSAWGACVRDSGGTSTSLAAGGSITVYVNVFKQTWIVQSSGGAVTLSTTPFGSTAPITNAELVLIGQSDTDTVTIPANDAAKGVLGYDVTLGRGQTATYKYNSTMDRYVIIATSN